MSLHFILQHGNAALYIVHVFIFTFFVLFFGFFKIFAQIYFLLFFIIFKVYQTDIVFVSSMYVLFLHVSLICFLIKSFILEIFFVLFCFSFFFFSSQFYFSSRGDNWETSTPAAVAEKSLTSPGSSPTGKSARARTQSHLHPLGGTVSGTSCPDKSPQQVEVSPFRRWSEAAVTQPPAASAASNQPPQWQTNFER